MELQLEMAQAIPDATLVLLPAAAIWPLSSARTP